jgi:hypothetical protein
MTTTQVYAAIAPAETHTLGDTVRTLTDGELEAVCGAMTNVRDENPRPARPEEVVYNPDPVDSMDDGSLTYFLYWGAPEYFIRY